MGCPYDHDGEMSDGISMTLSLNPLPTGYSCLTTVRRLDGWVDWMVTLDLVMMSPGSWQLI
jgi:hypothetical protein